MAKIPVDLSRKAPARRSGGSGYNSSVAAGVVQAGNSYSPAADIAGRILNTVEGVAQNTFAEMRQKQAEQEAAADAADIAAARAQFTIQSAEARAEIDRMIAGGAGKKDITDSLDRYLGKTSKAMADYGKTNDSKGVPHARSERAAQAIQILQQQHEAEIRAAAIGAHARADMQATGRRFQADIAASAEYNNREEAEQHLAQVDAGMRLSGLYAPDQVDAVILEARKAWDQKQIDAVVSEARLALLRGDPNAMAKANEAVAELDRRLRQRGENTDQYWMGLDYAERRAQSESLLVTHQKWQASASAQAELQDEQEREANRRQAEVLAHEVAAGRKPADRAISELADPLLEAQLLEQVTKTRRARLAAADSAHQENQPPPWVATRAQVDYLQRIHANVNDGRLIGDILDDPKLTDADRIALYDTVMERRGSGAKADSAIASQAYGRLHKQMAALVDESALFIHRPDDPVAQPPYLGQLGDGKIDGYRRVGDALTAVNLMDLERDIERWMAGNPNATPDQVEDYVQAIVFGTGLPTEVAALGFHERLAAKRRRLAGQAWLPEGAQAPPAVGARPAPAADAAGGGQSSGAAAWFVRNFSLPENPRNAREQRQRRREQQ